MTAFPITAREKATEAKREVAYRRKVYERLVATGRMKAADADFRIAVMEEIARDYERLAEADEREERLL